MHSKKELSNTTAHLYNRYFNQVAMQGRRLSCEVAVLQASIENVFIATIFLPLSL